MWRHELVVRSKFGGEHGRADQACSGRGKRNGATDDRVHHVSLLSIPVRVVL
jgi:hypothetical protein